MANGISLLESVILKLDLVTSQRNLVKFLELSKKVACWLGLACEVLDVVVHDALVLGGGDELQLVVRVGLDGSCGLRGALRGRVGGGYYITIILSLATFYLFHT